jgi:hypothetical protein
MTQTALVKPVALPLVTAATADFVNSLTTALGLPRDILASDEEIGIAWQQLPLLLNKIPAQLRGPLLARMCVAISVGLIDSAINYAWNAAVLELRDKVRRFGLTVVPEITSKPFDEQKLLDLQDSELLTLCLDLNLITEDGYFMLDQCRDIRNNFSAAHPTIGQVDAYEFISFLNRCSKYALSNLVNPKGVDTKAFIKAVKGPKFESIQRNEWIAKVKATHEAQRESLLLTLHGIYCDPSLSEEARLNALALAEYFASEFTASTKSQMIERHSGYRQAGDKGRHTASQLFFGHLALLNLLDDTEKHSLIVSAAKRLMGVHQAFNNFYNEPPFAARLSELTADVAVPATAREDYVSTVVACAIGNQYGTSNEAEGHYEKMIKGFTPGEVDVLFSLLHKHNLISIRVNNFARCKAAFKSLLKLIDPQSVSVKHKVEYEAYTA